MLIAENHGKVLAEAAGHEDYLTSAVFGLLRFVPPDVFWPRLFGKAVDSTEYEGSLAAATGGNIGGYERLDTWFWPSSKQHGEPDLALRFHGGVSPALFVLVEIKLESEKSGWGENDQLARYLKVLDEPSCLGIPANSDDIRCLVYLTPRNSRAEVEDSLTQSDSLARRRQLFRLQWQDVLDVADEEAPRCGEPAGTILRDIAAFLRRRGLEYFREFRMPPIDVAADDGPFYRDRGSVSGTFTGFATDELELFSIERGGWTR